MKNLRKPHGGALPGAARRAFAAFAVSFTLASGVGNAANNDVSLLRLTDIGGVAELGFFTALEDRSRAISPNSSFDRVEFSQLLGIHTSAYIYHPKFLTFDGGVKVEFIEDVLTTGRNRILAAGNWRFNFLQNHKNNFSAFGRVSRSESSRPFSQTFEIFNQLYGATFHQRMGWVPFHLTYQHRSTNSNGSGGFDYAADEILFNGEYHLGERSRGRIAYDLSFRDIGGSEVRWQSLSLNNSSHFGNEGEKRLFTNFNFNEQVTDRGSFTNERYIVSGNTNFDWRHSNNLWTEYNFAGRWSDYGTQSVTSLNPSFSITHKLYESLATNFGIFWRLEDASTNTRNQFGGAIRESYSKWLGEWGRLTVRASPRITMSYDRPRADTAEVFDENQTMADFPDEPQLLNPDVIESTVRVVNETSGEECVRDVDFRVDPVGGGFVVLSLTLDRTCLDVGVPVLVSYQYKLGGRADTLNTTLNVGTYLSILEHLGLFGSYQTSNQELLSGDEQNVRINEFDRSVVGIELTWPWFSARAEFEDYDSTFGPFQGYSGSISFSGGSKASWRAGLNAGYSYRDLTDTDETVGRLRLSGAFRKRLFRRGELEFQGRYRRERWSGDRADTDDIDTFSLNVGYSWWYGKINVKLEGGMAQILRETEDRRVYRVDLRARRSF